MDISRSNAFFDKLKQNVTDSFDRLRKAIDMREKLLLRQLTVVVQQAHHITFEYDSIRFLGEGEDDLVGRIRTYGRYNIDNFNIILQKEPYENEDYILPSNDHDLMHKSCRQGAEDERNPESEEIVVEFFNNRSLIKDSAEMVRESIINLTLNESRELIDRTIGGVGSKPYGPIETVTDEGTKEGVELLRACKIDPTTHRLHRGRSSVSDVPLDSLSFQGDPQAQQEDGGNNNVDCVANGNTKPVRSVMSRDGEKVISLSVPPHRMIPKASQTDGLISASTDSEGNVRESSTACKVAKDKRVKTANHVTMSSSCGSTINLKNVTNLTINACPERAVTQPLKEREHAAPVAAGNCPSEEGSPECGFYKRLITENKILRNHILKSKLVGSEKSPQPVLSSSVSDRSLSSATADGTTTHSSNQASNISDALSSSSTPSAPIIEPETKLNLPLSEQELQQMLELPSSMYDKSLSFVLGELYGLSSGGPDGGDGMATLSGAVTGTKTKEHTMQIQQWLKQIISEAETEPFQNAEMLEFSKIHD
uniref:Uncharacterized protein n=1 Tax=Anopheles dirus TaxID=7168 RepID=A0A182N7Y9_9DIPT